MGKLHPLRTLVGVVNKVVEAGRTDLLKSYIEVGSTSVLTLSKMADFLSLSTSL